MELDIITTCQFEYKNGSSKKHKLPGDLCGKTVTKDGMCFNHNKNKPKNTDIVIFDENTIALENDVEFLPEERELTADERFMEQLSEFQQSLDYHPFIPRNNLVAYREAVQRSYQNYPCEAQVQADEFMSEMDDFVSEMREFVNLSVAKMTEWNGVCIRNYFNSIRTAVNNTASSMVTNKHLHDEKVYYDTKYWGHFKLTYCSPKIINPHQMRQCVKLLRSVCYRVTKALGYEYIYKESKTRPEVSHGSFVETFTLGKIENGKMVKGASFTIEELERIALTYGVRFTYIDVIFMPCGPDKKIDSGGMYLNTFTGFLTELYEGEITPTEMELIYPMLCLIEKVICGGNKQWNIWVMSLLKHMTFHPELRARVFLLLLGPHRCGKSTLLEYMVKRVIGEKYGVILPDLDRYFTRFNSEIHNKTLACFNELPVMKDSKRMMDLLKTEITESTHTIEYKGKEPFSTENFIQMMFASNSNVRAMKLQEGDPRCAIPPVSADYVDNTEFFVQVHTCDDPKIVKIFTKNLQYFPSIDITNFKNIPYSQKKNDVIECSMYPHNMFIREIVDCHIDLYEYVKELEDEYKKMKKILRLPIIFIRRAENDEEVDIYFIRADDFYRIYGVYTIRKYGAKRQIVNQAVLFKDDGYIKLSYPNITRIIDGKTVKRQERELVQILPEWFGPKDLKEYAEECNKNKEEVQSF